MRYSTNLLASLIVLSTTVATQAQDFRGFFTPTAPNYGVIQSAPVYSQPYSTNNYLPQGNLLPGRTTIPNQYAPGSTYGSQQICPNGQCNLPRQQFQTQFQVGPYQQLSCPNGQCGMNSQFRPVHGNGYASPVSTCPNGVCPIRQNGTGLSSTIPFLNGWQGNNGLPFQQINPHPYGGVSIPLTGQQLQFGNIRDPRNITSTIPMHGNQTIRPVTNNPYYN